MKDNRKVMRSIALAFFVAIALGSPGYGQTQPPPSGSPEPQNGDAVEDPVRRLNLTPEQREQIRSIRQQTNIERAATNRRVTEANRALELALDSDTPDEATVEQRIRDLAAAQADAMRMRISTEVKIRRVLTVEQRTILRTLRQQARDTLRDRLEIRQERQRRRQERTNSLQNQRNGVGPLFPGQGARPRPRP